MVCSRMSFLNTQVNNLTMQEAVHEIEKYATLEEQSYVVTVNSDIVMKIENDFYLQNITNEAALVLTDGKPLIWISKLLGKQIKEKVSGSDLVPEVCKMAAEKGYTVFLLGGIEGIAEKARINLENTFPGIRIVGTYSPKFEFEEDEEELNKINNLISAVQPNILLACLGCPKQEKFIYENREKYRANVSICAGATIDFLAGNIKRAPKWMSDAGLEWFYRFLQEPKRLFKRYFVDDIKIVGLVLKYRKTNG